MLPHEDDALFRGAGTTQATLHRPGLVRRRHRRPLRREVQPDGRVRFWGEAMRPGEDTPRILRVVTLADGETVHNAFFDRGFRRDQE